MSLYITLVNNVKTFNNTMSDFKTRLGKTVVLTGQWYVGISEITYTKSWYNVLNDYTITLFDEMGNIYGDTNIINGNPHILKAGYYETPKKLIDELNNLFSSFEKIKAPPKLIYNDINNFLTLNVGYVEDGIKCFPDLGEELENLLGLRNRKKNTNYYEITNSMANIVFNGIENKDKIQAYHPVEISAGLHSMYMYSDVVYPSLVGDTFAPLLRVIEIPRKHKFGETIHITYQSPQYRPVRLNEFETIEISIKDDSGIEIPFKFGRVTVTLHFVNKI